MPTQYATERKDCHCLSGLVIIKNGNGVENTFISRYFIFTNFAQCHKYCVSECMWDEYVDVLFNLSQQIKEDGKL